MNATKLSDILSKTGHSSEAVISALRLLADSNLPEAIHNATPGTTTTPNDENQENQDTFDYKKAWQTSIFIQQYCADMLDLVESVEDESENSPGPSTTGTQDEKGAAKDKAEPSAPSQEEKIAARKEAKKLATRRSRARKRGEDVPKLKPGPKPVAVYFEEDGKNTKKMTSRRYRARQRGENVPKLNARGIGVYFNEGDVFYDV